MMTPVSPASVPPALLAVEERFSWSWEGVDITCPLTRRGEGPLALLLPALSSISTRSEMQPLQARLAERFETVAPDWPGFGTKAKPRVDWTPQAMAAWLDHVLTQVAPQPSLIVAAGHAAGYLLRHFSEHPESTGRAVLVAPTWRGPLPTMMGRRPPWLARVRRTMDLPVIGPALYALNLNPLVIGRMAKGHVYSDPQWLTHKRMVRKRAVARASGARFASVRFVTGALDPFETAEDAQAAAAALPKDKLAFVWGDDTPRKSKAAMAALAEAAGVAPEVLPSGKLALHEEFADDLADLILHRP
ncbi:MAG: alpha/beta hydrolase [Pseudomonadota bacterium]